MALAYANGSYKSSLEKLSGDGKMTPLGYNCQNKHHADAMNMVVNLLSDRLTVEQCALISLLNSFFFF